jgi:hypothetical protein
MQSQLLVEPPTRSTLTRWLLLFLALGLLWRIVRYLQGIPFWSDEAYLLVSILHQNYAGLLREPLEYGQVAPLLFVWVQRFLLERWDGGEWAMRLLPIAAGVAALLLFARVAWLELPPRAAALAVAIYAVSYRIVRHTTESKPYATDGFVAVLLLWAARGWWRAPDHLGHSAALILAGVIGVWLSYPAVFVAAAIGILMVARATGDSGRATDAPSRRRALAAWASCGVFGLAVGSSFLGHYVTYAGPQSARASGTWLEDYWAGSFPPSDSILNLARWFAEIHAGRMLGYPVGGANFASILTTIACIAGLAWLARRRQAFLLGMTLLPAFLTLAAAALHKYPYGGASRLSQHLAPMICLTAGAGVAALIERIRNPKVRERLAGAMGLTLIGIGLGGLTIDCVAPHRSPDEDEWVRPVVRDVVNRMEPADEVVCFNPPAGSPLPPDGPRFDPTVRYYLELYRGCPPVWLSEKVPPANTKWILAFVGQESGPRDEYVQSRLNELGLRVLKSETRRLSERRGTRLLIYRVQSAAAP